MVQQRLPEEASQGEDALEFALCHEEEAEAYGPGREPDLKRRAYRFCVELVRWAGAVERGRVSDVIIRQLIRSGKSVGASVVEAKSGSSRRDFTRFLAIALKSANESPSGCVWCETRDSPIVTA